MNGWFDYARSLAQAAIADGTAADSPEAICAIRALVSALEGYSHPSYYNTQFALAAHVFGKHELGRYAWRMVINGLGGYWQWETHNGGVFSVTKALVRLSLMSEEEASHPQQFDVFCTHSGCNYVVVRPEFLKRLVTCFQFPTRYAPIGGKDTFTLDETRWRDWLISEYGWHSMASDGQRQLNAVRQII